MGAGSTTTTKNDPWEKAMPYLEEIMSQGSGLYNSTDPTKEYQGISDEQRANLGQLQNYFGAGGGNQDYIDKNNAGLEELLGATTNWQDNAALQAGLDSNLVQANKQLTEGLLPAIRSGAAGAGQYGSSRQGVAEGVAQTGVNQNLTTANANMMNNYYNQAVQRQQAGMGLIPQGMEIGKSGLQGLIAGQEVLDADKRGEVDQNWYNKNQAMWDQLAKYQNVISPNATIGGTSTQKSSGASPLEQLLGLGIAGAGAYGAYKGN